MEKTIFIICGGIHHSQINDQFAHYFQKYVLNNAPSDKYEICVIPTDIIIPYDVCDIHDYLQRKYRQTISQHHSLVFICFSAGVVGCIGTARLWKKTGGIVKYLCAFDGWGVPLIADFPCYRVSHDYFTCLTSQFLGKADKNFYAHPAISHLDLWSFAASVTGYQQSPTSADIMTLTEFLRGMPT